MNFLSCATRSMARCSYSTRRARARPRSQLDLRQVVAHPQVDAESARFRFDARRGRPGVRPEVTQGDPVGAEGGEKRAQVVPGEMPAARLGGVVRRGAGGRK